METHRVQVDNSCARGNRLYFFVNTGNSNNEPIVCLGDNNGYPEVQAIYAKVRRPEFQGMNGIEVTVVLTGPANGNGLAVNISQPAMPGNKVVVPLLAD